MASSSTIVLHSTDRIIGSSSAQPAIDGPSTANRMAGPRCDHSTVRGCVSPRTSAASAPCCHWVISTRDALRFVILFPARRPGVGRQMGILQT